MGEHEQRLTELYRKPQLADHWHHEPTGETFGHLWRRLGNHERGKLLRDCRVRIEWTSTKAHIHLGDLEELATRARDSSASLTTTATSRR